MRRAFSHVGIYVGEGKFIHAPRTGAEVRVEDMNGSYWQRRFNGARRVLSAQDEARAATAALVSCAIRYATPAGGWGTRSDPALAAVVSHRMGCRTDAEGEHQVGGKSVAVDSG